MRKFLLAAIILSFGLSGPALAHFGMVIPSTPVVEDRDDAEVTVELSFGHPMQMAGMPLAKPESVRIVGDGGTEDLGERLQAVEIMGQDAWKVQYTVARPGVYAIVMEPEPYWEPAEDCFIVHHSKTYLAAFGEEEGWDEPLGLKTEIVPLTRPFGNYAGNVFQGLVLLNGKPAPGTLVEVEYYNREGRYAAPNEYLTTQTVKADGNGVFTYGIPFPGWWGFAALNEADEKITRGGEAKAVELGAVLWAEFVSPAGK
jgi:cobalt/nickel transport protein